MINGIFRLLLLISLLFTVFVELFCRGLFCLSAVGGTGAISVFEFRYAILFRVEERVAWRRECKILGNHHIWVKRNGRTAVI